MIIDCHVHPPDSDLETMLQRADFWGVNKLCMFALGNEIDPGKPAPHGHWPSTGGPGQEGIFSPPPERISASNDWVCGLLGQAPERLLGLCFVNPCHPRHALDEIGRLVGRGPMIGIKLWIACRANDPRVWPVAEAAIALGVPVLQHCWAKFGGNLEHESTPWDVADLARRYPELKLIAAHLSGLQEEGVIALAPHANVFLDTSGMLADTGMLEFALRHVGPERILFGSDAPGRNIGAALARIRNSSLSPDVEEAILGANFNRLFFP